MAQQVLTQFQEHPDSWTRVPDILEKSSFPQAKVRHASHIMHLRSSFATKYIGLQILEKLITTKWKTLPDGQRQGQRSFHFILISLRLYLYLGIRNFIVGITVKVASDEVALRKEKTYINKLNLALVQVRLLPGVRIVRAADHKC